MRALLVLLACAACDAGQRVSAPTTPVPIAPIAPVASVVPVAADAGVPPGTTLLQPVGMAGPFATLVAACHSAKPCGFTDMDAAGRMTHPATKTSCPAIESADRSDPNAVDPSSGAAARVAHTASGMELRIGSQHCDAPQGLRSETDVYYMFVKRPDGWWRSDALWQWDYNDKYTSGSMIVRWNDQPGRTFAGIAAAVNELACNAGANARTTDELMVRVEQGTARPLVWGPLVVGRRHEVALLGPPDPGTDCRPEKTSHELTETWSSPDDLELAGSATWPSLERTDGVLSIGLRLRDGEPSSVGKYRFVRP
ncbi:MAG TPA: hypothetical protein VGG74_29135 [Kofleriaceae bacterium]|jgi:hypothetical protein